MIGYYIHHQGRGHLLRARAVCARTTEPVTALTSLPGPVTGPFHDVVRLPPDDGASAPTDVTASGVLHWVPQHDPGLRERMAALSHWIATARPAAMVVDVSVEVALLARLHGIPVITMVLPGTRTDRPHRLVHDMAEALIAAWPRELYHPDWLREYDRKTHYVGGISLLADSPLHARPAGNETDRPTVLVLAGAGGTDITDDTVDACVRECPQYSWRTAGLHDWVDDLRPVLAQADVVVAHAGQGAIADIAAVRRPAIVIPAARPFGEQKATATALEKACLATVVDEWPAPERWPALLGVARAHDPARWRSWRTEGAAHRAAAVIDSLCRTGFPAQ